MVKSTALKPMLISCKSNLWAGLHRLWYPVVRDMSTWSKFGAHGEHGDVFLFSNLGALWFSENLIRYSLHICLREVKNNFFPSKTLIYGISCDDSKKISICTCEHMILGQLTMGAHQTKMHPCLWAAPDVLQNFSFKSFICGGGENWVTKVHLYIWRQYERIY